MRVQVIYQRGNGRLPFEASTLCCGENTVRREDAGEILPVSVIGGTGVPVNEGPQLQPICRLL
jgi:hypothetical protein